MIPINGQRLALVSKKPKDGLRYKTVNASGWWLIKTDEVQKDIEYSQKELSVIKSFIGSLWIRGYRKTMEQLVRATKNKDIIDCFYRSSTLKDFLGINQGTEIAKDLPESLYQKRRYSVYRLCQDLVGKEVCIVKDLVGEYNRISSIDSKRMVKMPETDWIKVESLIFNQERANVSLKLEGTGSRCIIKDGTLNMKYLAIKSDKLPKELKKAVVMTVISNDEYLLDLSKLPISSRSDFGRRLTSKQLIWAVANLEYAKLAKAQFPREKKEKDSSIVYEERPKERNKKYYSYKATSLVIHTDYTWTKLQGDQGKNWDEEYEKWRKLKSKLVFELFAKKLYSFQEPGSREVIGCKESVKVGPEKITIRVKLKEFVNKEIKL